MAVNLKQEMAENIRYCFEAEWFDVHAQLFRKYEFFFYPSDRTIEMVTLLFQIEFILSKYLSMTQNKGGHF